MSEENERFLRVIAAYSKLDREDRCEVYGFVMKTVSQSKYAKNEIERGLKICRALTADGPDNSIEG